MSYTNEQLEKIYKDACNHSISDKELDNIKEALHSLSSIVKFNPVEYARLIKILKSMPKDKLDKISDFKELYIAAYKDSAVLFNSPLVCNSALHALFADYSNVNTKREFKDLSNDMMYVIPCITSEGSIETMGKINVDLKEVLVNSFEFFANRPSIKENFGYASSINRMYEEAVVTFLINKELYKSDYSLPSRVIMSLLDNKYDSIELMSMYFNCKDVEAFMKALFNTYIKQNGMLFDNDKTKVKSGKKTLVS